MGVVLPLPAEERVVAKCSLCHDKGKGQKQATTVFVFVSDHPGQKAQKFKSDHSQCDFPSTEFQTSSKHLREKCSDSHYKKLGHAS